MTTGAIVAIAVVVTAVLILAAYLDKYPDFKRALNDPNEEDNT